MLSDDDVTALQLRMQREALRSSDAQRLLVALLYERGARKEAERLLETERAYHADAQVIISRHQEHVAELNQQVTALRESMATVREMLRPLKLRDDINPAVRHQIDMAEYRLTA